MKKLLTLLVGFMFVLSLAVPMVTFADDAAAPATASADDSGSDDGKKDASEGEGDEKSGEEKAK